MSWRALLCSLHRFTVARRSLARSTRRTSRRSVSSGYVGRCRSGPLPSLPASHCRRRRRRWDRSLRRRRIMQRECAMIKDQPSSTADTIHPTRSSAGECVQPHYYREPIRKRRRASALDPLAAGPIVAVTDKWLGFTGAAFLRIRARTGTSMICSDFQLRPLRPFHNHYRRIRER